MGQVYVGSQRTPFRTVTSAMAVAGMSNLEGGQVSEL